MTDLQVNLVDPMGVEAPSAHKTIRISRPCCGKLRTLDISLVRTIRVPDNERTYELPPDLGRFPIYNVEDYSSKLPPSLVKKGGLFIPLYQREAMWINFTCRHPFAVKVILGGVNAVSGNPSKAQLQGIITRQRSHLAKSQSAQDYLVPPAQLWLDGVATGDGKVMQFVATPVNSGYSVEAQVTGAEDIAGIQFEVTPKHQDSYIPIKPTSTESPASSIFVKTLTGKRHHLHVAPCYTVGDVKELIQACEGVSPDQQRLLHSGKALPDCNHELLSNCEISEGSVIHLALKIGGGGATIPATGPNEDEVKEVTLGAGGLIEQVIHSDSNPNSWDAEKTILFNLQLFDASCFKYILGIDPPKTPITAATYAKYGYPFFHLYEQPSGIYGELHLDSIGALDRRDGIYSSIHEEEKDLTFPSVDIVRRGTNAVTLNTVDEKTKFVPFQELSGRLKTLHLS